MFSKSYFPRLTYVRRIFSQVPPLGMNPLLFRRRLPAGRVPQCAGLSHSPKCSRCFLYLVWFSGVCQYLGHAAKSSGICGSDVLAAAPRYGCQPPTHTILGEFLKQIHFEYPVMREPFAGPPGVPWARVSAGLVGGGEGLGQTGDLHTWARDQRKPEHTQKYISFLLFRCLVSMFEPLLGDAREGAPRADRRR